MSGELYSVDEVADRLGLHVRTVRNYVRDGRLKAVRIGKQYRIAREDLEALTGRTVPASRRAATNRHRHVEVSSIVQIDAIGSGAAERVSTTLMAAAAGGRDDGEQLRIETMYDEERARMRIVVLGGVAVTVDVLRLVGVLVEANE